MSQISLSQFTEQAFPFVFDSADILRKCRLFLDGGLSREKFEAFLLEKNQAFKLEDIELDILYRSGGMGRPGIMDGAPEYAKAFREEINRILGTTFAWQ